MSLIKNEYESIHRPQYGGLHNASTPNPVSGHMFSSNEEEHRLLTIAESVNLMTKVFTLWGMPGGMVSYAIAKMDMNISCVIVQREQKQQRLAKPASNIWHG